MKLNFLTCLFIVIHSAVFAQTFTGIVIDEFRNSIQAVSILNTTTNQATISDEQGKFILENVSSGDSLQFYHISYKLKIVEVKNVEATLNVVLPANEINLSEIVISPRINALQLIADIDIQANPVNSSQDVLRKVPGLFIGQHAGGGKAEQIFLRGFDIDHGTDISLTVDGLPVNIVSHAHGQGYADLHFVIPETIDKIDFGKGTYYENIGNFNTAGYVNFMTKNRLDKSSIKLEAGQFDTYRVLGMLNLLDNNDQNAYIATEYSATDGPFESPQNFNRSISETDWFGITTSHFTSKWDASGQIPQRAVASGDLSRFGAIDDTEGGNTSRTNLLINYNKIIDGKSSIKSHVFLCQYDFELYSNFTFFLEDSINGDQIRQKENRIIYGVNSEYKKLFSTNKLNGSWHAGINLRNDQSSDNELSRTINRSETLEQIQLGNINETNLGVCFGTTTNIAKWTFNPSVRVDYFDFQYNDALLSTYKTQTETKAIISPKFNILYTQSQELQLYLKSGKGFHSNDTRVVVAEQGNKILPSAYGFDAGFMWKPTSQMLLYMAYWYLYLEQEFVYVGDAGIVEPSGKTRRQGIDLSYRYQPLPWLFWNLDVNYTYVQAIEEPKGQNYIPLAPDFTLVGGLNFLFKSGLYGSVNVRHLANRPANEDNSIVAKGYTITDLNAAYKLNNIRLGIQIQNLFDTKWNETQFATESRLQNETEPVEEIHFTPGTPFFLKAMLQYNF